MKKATEVKSKEIIDAEPVTGVFQAMQYAKEQIFKQLLTDGLAKKGTKFEDITWRPLFGEKYTDNMKNLGTIIGYYVSDIKGASVDQVKLASAYQLRADYDDVKGAHINYGCTANNSTFCRAVKVKISPVESFARTPLQAVEYAWDCMTKKHFNEVGLYEDQARVRNRMSHNNVQNRYCYFPIKVADVEAAINAVVRKAAESDGKSHCK